MINRIPLILDSSYYSAEFDVPRSQGVHLMQIIGKMEDDRNEILGIKSNKNGTPEDLEAYRFGGFMFEHLIAQHIINVECERNPEKLVRPGEVFWCKQCKKTLATSSGESSACLAQGHTGIFATPDAIRTDTWRLKEWKFTWKSLKRGGGDNDEDGTYENIRDGIWRWIIQTMAYCYLMETLGADLEAFFVNGDYTNRVPKIMRYEMDFEQHELDENWMSVVNTAEDESWI